MRKQSIRKGMRVKWIRRFHSEFVSELKSKSSEIHSDGVFLWSSASREMLKTYSSVVEDFVQTQIASRVDSFSDHSVFLDNPLQKTSEAMCWDEKTKVAVFACLRYFIDRFPAENVRKCLTDILSTLTVISDGKSLENPLQSIEFSESVDRQLRNLSRCLREYFALKNKRHDICGWTTSLADCFSFEWLRYLVISLSVGGRVRGREGDADCPLPAGQPSEEAVRTRRLLEMVDRADAKAVEYQLDFQHSAGLLLRLHAEYSAAQTKMTEMAAAAEKEKELLMSHVSSGKRRVEELDEANTKMTASVVRCSKCGRNGVVDWKGGTF